MLTKYQKNINSITTLISGDCDDDSEGGEGDGDGEEAHDALKARLLYEGFNLKVIVYFCSKMHKF